MEISTIGLDLAKNVFQVHGVDASGTVVVRKALRRAQVSNCSPNKRSISMLAFARLISASRRCSAVMRWRAVWQRFPESAQLGRPHWLLQWQTRISSARDASSPHGWD